jgi:Spy/CpxP family protein refolding chaperone
LELFFVLKQYTGEEFHTVKRRLLTALIFLTLAAPLVFAQKDFAHTRTPAQIVANRVARLTTLLMLTPGQATEATTIFTTEQSALSSAAANMKTARTALQTAIQANNLAEINTAAGTIGTLTTTEVAAHATADAAFYALLSPAQQTQYKQLGRGGFEPRDRHR